MVSCISIMRCGHSKKGSVVEWILQRYGYLWHVTFDIICRTQYIPTFYNRKCYPDILSLLVLVGDFWHIVASMRQS